MQIDWSQTSAEAEGMLAELVELHQARWQSVGEPGAFASPAFRAFHLELVQRLVPACRAALVRVRAGQRIIGCTLLYFDQNRALVYQGGWSSTQMRGKSLGLINDFCCLRECLRRGFDAYDFMAGDSTHKRRLTTDQGQLAWATHQKSSWKHQTVERLRSAKRFWMSLFQKPAVPTQPARKARSATVAESTAEIPS
jgi:CelD/BcsL family acetyltransferase involved in cellulose biosynthesis